MKKYISLFICLTIISCKTKVEKRNPSIHTKWMLIQFKDFQKQKIMDKNCYLDLTNKENSSAKMGCNDLGFRYILSSNNKIEFGLGRTTYMYCEDHDIESEFLNIVNSIESYKIQGHKLYLKTKTNGDLIFVAEDWD
ncbi:META domain-containing protein [uncultured Flavobacterium sp.]|uniref:META domain-containing protein n=1 Tax=uncultured Flavobacterium sp. TaxID=165435 RepID=UPI0030CA17FE